MSTWRTGSWRLGTWQQGVWRTTLDRVWFDVTEAIWLSLQKDEPIFIQNTVSSYIIELRE